MLRNPTCTACRDLPEDDPTLSVKRICAPAALSPTSRFDRYDKEEVQATDLGRIASQYYVSRDGERFHEHLKPQMGDIELCRLFSQAEEFKFVKGQEGKIEPAR